MKESQKKNEFQMEEGCLSYMFFWIKYLVS